MNTELTYIGHGTYHEQLAFDFQALSLADLRSMLAAGMVEPCGATEGGVVSYRLTSVGRIVLGNQLRKEARE